MFRISTKEDRETVALQVEGRLAGPWVSELEKCWRTQQGHGTKRIVIRLSAVTFIDDAGKALLSQMFDAGAKLEGAGCMVRAILGGITSREPHNEGKESIGQAGSQGSLSEHDTKSST